MVLLIIKILVILTAIEHTLTKDGDIEDMSDKYEDTILEAHNKIRKAHKGTSPLEKLTDNAYTRKRCKAKVPLPLSGMPAGTEDKYGENIYRMSGKGSSGSAGFYEKVAKLVSVAWGKKAQDYDKTRKETPNPSSDFLSYTQMVWKETKQMACGVCGQNKGGKTHVTIICNYLPAGNVKDHFKDNIGVLPMSRTTAKMFSKEDMNEAEHGQTLAQPMKVHEKMLKASADDTPDDATTTEAEKLLKAAIDDNVDDKSSEVEKTILDAHNLIRKAHQADPLTLITDNTYTRNRCKAKVGKKLSFSPEGTEEKYGENIYRMNGKGDLYKKVAKVVSLAWSKTAEDYDKTYSKQATLSAPDSKYLSYTQMVWKGTKQMTCGVCGQTDKNKKTEVTVVCHYLPAGNVKDQYKTNIKPPMGRSSWRDNFEEKDIKASKDGEVGGLARLADVIQAANDKVDVALKAAAPAPDDNDKDNSLKASADGDTSETTTTSTTTAAADDSPDVATAPTDS